MSNRSGPKNSNWRGGRVVDPRGYVLIRVGKDHPLADVRGYAYEHRLVASAKAPLASGVVVHHEDENKGNNVETNLIPESRAAHRVHHRKHKNSGLRMPEEPNPVVECLCGCGVTFERFDEEGRPRKFLPGHNAHPAPTFVAILAILCNGPAARTRIVEATGLSKFAVAVALSRLKKAGRITNIANGVWALIGGGSDG